MSGEPASMSIDPTKTSFLAVSNDYLVGLCFAAGRKLGEATPISNL